MRKGVICFCLIFLFGRCNRGIKIWEEKEPDTDNEFDEPEYDEHLL